MKVQSELSLSQLLLEHAASHSLEVQTAARHVANGTQPASWLRAVGLVFQGALETPLTDEKGCFKLQEVSNACQMFLVPNFSQSQVVELSVRGKSQTSGLSAM
eukprot:gnl/MRDRNA2_/MRDRNA2_797274_c0_seq1.p1 gnl/MRDRNA2_/MRDRNA2_797274_c0~~gnl/MRDRNA2_/MRDRNA2_797274_c0_seq1.p1  ORF type:complete len:103 (-),score=16.91 gnl/MRDRNA2_/MRDRNA2_797274_c0_seq1:116-424(-)